MDFQSFGRLLLIAAAVLGVIGALFLILPRIPGLSQLGSLPGDIRIEGSGFTCLVPIVSSILLSIVLTVVLNLIIRFLNRP